ncbi:MAG TPA: hypothetical protein PLM89_07685, partial [Anaerolineales bacterium]|nr:hypothetical protein [Anaerolineales bacterium]
SLPITDNISMGIFAGAEHVRNVGRRLGNAASTSWLGSRECPAFDRANDRSCFGGAVADRAAANGVARERGAYRLVNLEKRDDLAGFGGSRVRAGAGDAANREVWFPSFSRYTLAASLGAAILIAAWVSGLSKPAARWGILAIFILASVFTHYGNGLQYATQTQRTREFWWQVAWRAPQFQINTTLIANIASVSTEEDYFVWGPANFLYYPESQNDKMAQPSLYAAILNKNTVQKVLIRKRQEYDNRRGIITYKNYRNILILSQPSPTSCVHVIDGFQPEFSAAESDSIRVIGSFSELEHVLADETPRTPPPLVFGPEPPRGWCYFYQSADLARQRGEWEAIVGLGKEAQALGFSPSDLIEWMPFLQAYAITDDADRLAELVPVISAEPYIALQVCRIIGGLQGISDSIVEIIDSQYCPE